MDPNAVLDLILGNVGTLVLLLLIVYALVSGGQLVAGKTHQETEKRAAVAEAESEEYAQLLRKREETISGLKVAGARLEEQLAAARRDLERMEGRQIRQTRMISEIHDEIDGGKTGEER